MTNLILKLSISPTLVAIYQLHLHMGYTFPNLFDFQQFAAPTQNV